MIRLMIRHFGVVMSFPDGRFAVVVVTSYRSVTRNSVRFKDLIVPLPLSLPLPLRPNPRANVLDLGRLWKSHRTLLTNRSHYKISYRW